MEEQQRMMRQREVNDYRMNALVVLLICLLVSGCSSKIITLNADGTIRSVERVRAPGIQGLVLHAIEDQLASELAGEPPPWRTLNNWREYWFRRFEGIRQYPDGGELINYIKRRRVELGLPEVE